MPETSCDALTRAILWYLSFMARLAVSFALIGSLVALPASAAPGKLFGHEVLEVEPLSEQDAQTRRDEFEAMLDDKGWVQHGDEIRPAAPDGSFAQEPAPQAGLAPPHRSTIFLNFFGQEGMTNGTNAALDQSNCVNSPMDWPGFGGTEAQALALIDVFEINMEPYGVRIAYEERPPAHLPYAMVMMGGSPGMLGLQNGVLGVSCSSDCADMWWRDATFAFTDAINPNNAEVLGTTALHEAAHAFGLAHIDNPARIMNPFVGSGDVPWATECTPYNDATGGINCQATHASFCNGEDAQNTNAELMSYFGPNSPDVIAPSVEITSPADGTMIAPGETITIEVDVSDDHEGFGWQLVVPELDQAVPSFTFQKEWPLSFPEGVYTIRVEAIDHDRNEASDEITLRVGVEGSEGGSADGTGDDGQGEGDGTAAADDAGSDEDSDPSGDDGTDDGVGAMDDGGDKACNCRADRRSPAGWLALFLVPLALRRRD